MALGALWLVLHVGISKPSTMGRPVDPQRYRTRYRAMLKRQGVPYWPDELRREISFGAGLVVLIVVLAITVGPPALAIRPGPSCLWWAPA